MNIQHYHHDHAHIYQQINSLRELSRSGVRENALKISELITGTASRIKFHLAAEERVLYPTMAAVGDARVAVLGERYQNEMQGIAQAFADFVTQWRVPSRLAADPDGFRNDANTVLRALFDRLKREEVELYPIAETI